jgi:hypothetical protein
MKSRAHSQVSELLSEPCVTTALYTDRIRMNIIVCDPTDKVVNLAEVVA